MRIENKITRIRDIMRVIWDQFQSHQASRSISDSIVNVFFQNYRSRGLEYAIRHLKTSRLFLTRYLCRDKLSSSLDFGVSQDGLPKWLKEILIKNSSLHLIGGEYESCDKKLIKTLLTALSISRCFTLKSNPDIGTIKEKSEADIGSITDIELETAAIELGIKRTTSTWIKFHSSTKSGPNGQAILSSLFDFTLLPLPLKESIFKIAGEKLEEKMLDLEQSNKSLDLINKFYLIFPSKPPKRIRKLSHFADKEGKTRVIAILDYWTQTALRPLHDSLNSHLARLETDCTYNQGHFHSSLSSPSPEPFYSLDLKAATDRMPVLLQERVIAKIIGAERAKSWREILTEYEFEIEKDQQCMNVKYMAGQPMGAYSSWPAMALTHHVLVKVAAIRSGCTGFNQYSILGDDVVIRHSKVAEQYKMLLSHLDMPISSEKTHISHHMYEFAKRWIFDGVEVTAFSVNSILETWRNYAMFQNSIETQLNRGWQFKENRAPGSFLEAIMVVYGKFQQSKRTKKLIIAYNLLQDFIKSCMIEGSNKSHELWELLALPDTQLEKESLIRLLIRYCLIEQGYQDKIQLLTSFKDYYVLIIEKLKLLNLGAQQTELTRKALIDCAPITNIFNDQREVREKQLVVLKEGSAEEISQVYLEKLLAGSAFNLGVFSMRTSHSRTLARCKIVKQFWNLAMKIIPDLKTLDDFPEPEQKEVRRLEKIVARFGVRSKRIRSMDKSDFRDLVKQTLTAS